MPTPRVVALSFAVMVAALLCAEAHAWAAQASSITVALQVKREDDVSGIAWTAMTNEARAIWAREGVDLIWDTADTTATLKLPVSFDDHALRKYDKERSAALGMTLFEGRSQHILISAPRARRMATATASDALAPSTIGRESALGRLLGRVLAHEIGHALLLTTRHSASGLMSGNIMPRQVPPFDTDLFALSIRERDQLATRFSNRPETARRSIVIEGVPANMARWSASRSRR